MTLPLDLSIHFSGAALSYSATGLPDGLEIDPATGVVTGAFAAPGASVVTVTASNQAGEAVGAFNWLVEEATVIEAPENTAPPSIIGAAVIGETLNVEPGTWTGAPDFAFQWLRNGAPISGATGAAYVLAASDDLAEIAVRVTATNESGSAAAASAGAVVRYQAPFAEGGLQDQEFSLGGGARTVDAAADFIGAVGGAWSVSGAGATIDAAGVVSIPTDAPLADASVIVEYANSGGAASSAFSVTVKAAPSSIAVDSASVRFPVSNPMAASADMAYIALPNFKPIGVETVWAGDACFMASISMPAQSWSDTTKGWMKTNTHILGNGNSGGSANQSFSIFARPTRNLDERGNELVISVSGSGRRAEIDIGRERDFLAVARQVGSDLFIELYKDGVRFHSSTLAAMPEENFRNGFKIGAQGRGSDGLPVSFGGDGAFDGSVGFFGYIDGTVTQAQCEAISAGADPAAEITGWHYAAKFTDPSNTAPFADPTGKGAFTFVGSGFRKGGDIHPTRSGAAWFKLDPVFEGHVWSVAPGASTALITLSGKASGVTGQVEARYFDADGTVRKDWTVLAGSTIAGGAWEGTMEAPLGKGWGHVEARPVSSPAMVQRSRAECGVGYDIYPLGQSQVEIALTEASRGVTPSATAALSIAERIWSGTVPIDIVSQTPISPGRPVSDGLAAMASYAETVTDAPVRIISLAESGTGVAWLLDDSDTRRNWSDLVRVLDLAKPTSGAVVMNWGTAQLSVPDQAGNFLDPLWKGAAPTTQTYSVDHHIQGGDFPPETTFAISPITPHFSKGEVGPLASNPSTFWFQPVSAYNINKEMEAWCADEGLVYGPEIPGFVLEAGGNTHQDRAVPYGSERLLIRMAETGFRALGISGATDPTLGTAVRSGATITIPATLPNGGTLQTAWSIAGVTPPAGWTTVQGFEVSEDGGATWSNGASAASASPEFSAEIVGSSVVLTRAAGTWAAGTMWRYAAMGPLNYGETTKPLRLQHGLLYEGDGDGTGPVPQLASEGGIGLPVRSKEGVAA
ncbi:Ig domain-containing protein [Pikeienuella sp. HZG-20]|uniref:Ig domain-containing protein n=1 Tax=Paludibacillus litoralis TaxID=3133267 RepID=UPI0030EC44F0